MTHDENFHLSLDDFEDDSSRPRQESTERLLLLIAMLTANTCTRNDIFKVLAVSYKIDDSDETSRASSRRQADRIFERDVEYLEQQGYIITKTPSVKDKRVTCYGLVAGSGIRTPFLFSNLEVETLIILFSIFSDPAVYTPSDVTHPLPQSPPRHPFAQGVLTLLERFVTTLPEKQQAQFNEAVRKPFVYFNVSPVTDYLPHRATIDFVVDAISRQKPISFRYLPSRGKTVPVFHERVDPYYIIHLDGHFYLSGYSYKMSTFFEYRIDRIVGESLQTLQLPIDQARRQKPIEFRYWADQDLIHSGLSQRWLTQTIEDREEYIDAHHRTRQRFLVRATAYNEWRILQQLHKYAQKVVLVEPAHLRDKMRQELEQTLHSYVSPQ